MARPGPLGRSNATRINQHSSRHNTVINVTGKVTIPTVKKEWNWHQLAADWYKSLKLDGQAALYEPSHWRTARIIAQMLSDELNLHPAQRKGARLKNYFDLLKQIYATPDALQRANIEIQRVLEAPQPTDQDPKPPSKIEDIKKRARRAM